MKLNAEQIIKALECCKDESINECVNCPYNVFMNCDGRVRNDAFALIKQLTEEVATWKAIAEGYQKKFEDCAEDRARLTDENAELKRLRLCELVKANNLACDNALLQTVTAQRERTTVIPKSKIEDIYTSGMMDGVRQMQTRLTQYIGTYTDKSFVYVSAMFKLVDRIAKELIGDE